MESSASLILGSGPLADDIISHTPSTLLQKTLNENFTSIITSLSSPPRTIILILDPTPDAAALQSALTSLLRYTKIILYHARRSPIDRVCLVVPHSQS